MKHNIKQGEMLSTTTVRIETRSNSGKIEYGTGFFYSIGEDTHYIPCLITNRHVVEEAKDLTIIVKTVETDGNERSKHITYKMTDVQPGIIYHPNPNVDLCAVTLFPIVNELRSEGIDIYTYFFNKPVIPSKEEFDDMDTVEEVLMIGYPSGLMDETNSLPLFRKGITSTNPKNLLDGKREFLVDMACFPGSSGSPVVHLNKQYKTEVGYGIHGYELKLLGVLYGGHMQTFETCDNKGNVIGTVKVPMNLGTVIRADSILELEEEIIKYVDAPDTPNRIEK